MSIQDLISKENSSAQEIKNAITKYLKVSSKSPKEFAIKNKVKLGDLTRKWSSDDSNQPQVTNLAKFLSQVELEDGQEYLAAKALQLIRFNSLNIGLNQKQRLDIQLRICELFIAAKDVYSGEDVYKQLKKTKDFNTISGVSDKNQAQFLQMRYKLVDAQYLRLVGKHADAGQIYLSYITNPKLQQFPTQRDHMVQSAILCMILSNQSPKRASLLANLYESQIVKKHTLFQFVQKILFGNIISKQQSNVIDKLLTTSERKVTQDGVTPLERAVFQHNIRCLPKLYQDITFKTLNELLGLSNSLSFFTQLQQMIFGGFPAQIDQVEELVTFIPNEASEKGYNQRITNYCEALDRFIENNRI